MAEAIIGSYDPTTGERKESTWEYKPVQPPSPGLMTPNRANALLNYAAQTDPKSVPALYRRLEATMEFQRRIAAGQKPHEALTPDIAGGLFPSGTGSAIRAFTPKPVNPRDEVLLEIDKARRDEMLRKAKEPPKSNIPTEWNRDPSKTYVSPGGAVILPKTDRTSTVSPTAAASLLKSVTDKYNPLSKSPLTNSISALQAIVQNAISGPQVPVVNPKNTQLGSSASVKEVIRYTKDGRKAIFDEKTKQFIRYAD